MEKEPFKITAPGWYVDRRGEKHKIELVGKHRACAEGPSGYFGSWTLAGAWYNDNIRDDRDLIAHYHEPGSAAWANALPVGTKVRHVSWSINGWRSKRQDGTWINDCGEETHSPYVDSGWELYTEPEPKPWSRPEDVPLGAIIRLKGSKNRHLIVSAFPGGVESGTTFKGTYQWLNAQCEHSTDGGKTWGPCVVQEDKR